MTRQELFPVSDNNNQYAEMASKDLTTIQVTDPTITVKQIKLDYTDHGRNSIHPDRISFRIPLINVNDYMIQQVYITGFCVDYSGFLPTIMVEFTDVRNDFLVKAFPKDGSLIKLYIGGLGDELYYKPIRQDFLLTSVMKIGGPINQNDGSPMRYRIMGVLNVPVLQRKESWCDSAINARQMLFNMAIYSGLGFATNFDVQNNIDVMQWNNPQSRALQDFVKDITSHACYSPSTFFTSFVDQYYVLNFIEVHSLLSHAGNKSDIPAMIYTNTQQVTRPDTDDPKNNSKLTENEIVVKDGDSPLSNSDQKVSYYFISNNSDFYGWSNFIEEYYEINNSSSSMSDGYKVQLSYSDMNAGSWGTSNCNFLIYPIDNLKRDVNGYIEPLSEEPTIDSYIPLNLAQTTSSLYLEEESGNDIDNLTSSTSTISMGQVDTSNTFKQYYFAKVQNDYQMKCLKKCGLSVKLQNYNPAITKFSRIWVDIYDKNPSSNMMISKQDIPDHYAESYKDILKKANDNILQFNKENVVPGERPDAEKDSDYPRGTYNRGLSGWYVVTDMKITFNPKTKNLQTNLILNRIEYKPVFKTDYTLAKDSINKKYRNENTPDKLFSSNEDEE